MTTDIYLRNFANHFNKWFEKGFEELIRCLKNCNVNIWLSSGPKEYWSTSIHFALKSGGYTIWGRRIDDISMLKDVLLCKNESPSKNSKDKSKSSVLASIRNIHCNYIDAVQNNVPLINVFYVDEKVGIIGAGIFTLLILDVNTIFWDEEIQKRKVIFPIRWLSKVFWLHNSVRANPFDVNSWKGENPPPRTPLQSGLQPIRDPELVKKFCEVLLEHSQEFQETLRFFEKYRIEQSEMKPKAPQPQLVSQPSAIIPTSCVIDIGHDKINEVRKRIVGEFIIDEAIVDWLLNLLLYSCKNVLLVGKPGVGKTALARRISELLGFKPLIFTAHAHWSRHDVIGGPMLSSSGEVVWRSGILIKALVEHVRAKSEGFRGAWLIIDEVNRADVDKAYGEFFTIFSSVDSSDWIIPLNLLREIKDYVKRKKADEYAEEFMSNVCNDDRIEIIGCRVPPDFRVIATLNYVDVANLFTLGEAFTRRFARIVIEHPTSENEIEKEIEWFINNRIRKDYGDHVAKELRNVVSSTHLAKRIEGLRSIPGIAFGFAHTYSILQIISGYINRYTNLEKEKDYMSIVRRAIEAMLPLNQLWDEDLKKKIDEVLSERY